MKKVALLFPGSGSQYIGMGKTLYKEHKIVREVFEEASNAIDIDLMKLCFEGSMEELSDVKNTQPAVVAVSYAAFKVYMKEIGIEPEYLAGHSLGEYSALACAEAIKFSDAVKLARKRGEFISEASKINKGTAAAVGKLDVSQIKKICEMSSSENNHLGIACYNAPTQIVISGHTNAIENVEGEIIKANGKYTRLKIDFATHSVLLKKAGEMLNEELKKYEFNNPKWSVISNVTAKPYEGTNSIIENLVTQMTESVKWQPTMEYIKKKGVTVAVELGPKTALRGLVRKNLKYVDAFSFDNKEDEKELTRLLLTKDRRYIPPFVSRCLAAAIATKNNNFNEEQYEKGVIIPCSEMRKKQLQLEVEGNKLTTQEKIEILKKLKLIFETKGVNLAEQRERFNDILKDTHTKDEIDIKDIV